MLLSVADGWEKPRFALTGRDVIAAGVPEGPAVGRVLSQLEEGWIESDFAEDEASLAARLAAIVQTL
jgi:poly(A) polymerase